MWTAAHTACATTLRSTRRVVDRRGCRRATHRGEPPQLPLSPLLILMLTLTVLPDSFCRRLKVSRRTLPGIVSARVGRSRPCVNEVRC